MIKSEKWPASHTRLPFSYDKSSSCLCIVSDEKLIFSSKNENSEKQNIRHSSHRPQLALYRKITILSRFFKNRRLKSIRQETAESKYKMLTGDTIPKKRKIPHKSMYGISGFAVQKYNSPFQLKASSIITILPLIILNGQMTAWTKLQPFDLPSS